MPNTGNSQINKTWLAKTPHLQGCAATGQAKNLASEHFSCFGLSSVDVVAAPRSSVLELDAGPGSPILSHDLR
jgi:hypothetical protein